MNLDFNSRATRALTISRRLDQNTKTLLENPVTVNAVVSYLTDLAVLGEEANKIATEVAMAGAQTDLNNAISLRQQFDGDAVQILGVGLMNGQAVADELYGLDLWGLPNFEIVSDAEGNRASRAKSFTLPQDTIDALEAFRTALSPLIAI